MEWINRIGWLVQAALDLAETRVIPASSRSEKKLLSTPSETL